MSNFLCDGQSSNLLVVKIEAFIKRYFILINMNGEIIRLFQEVGEHYRKKGVAELDLYQKRDIHAFYRLSQVLTKVIHVQGYPGLSSDHKAIVLARIMDHNKLLDIRRNGRASIGNEHEATTQMFPNLIIIPYSSKILEERLAEFVPELR